MTQSRRFSIASTLYAAVQAAPDLAGVKFRRNPRDPSNIKDGPRVVFLEEQLDAFVDEKGQAGKRRFVFALGVINRSEDDADAGADADHVAAEQAIRDAANDMTKTLEAGPLRETQTLFKVEGVDVGGALILSTFEIEYRRPKPART